MRERQLPLVNAILYADIFNFALTKEELFRYAIGKCAQSDLENFINNTPTKITYTKGLFCLKKNSQNITLRNTRKNPSQHKLISAKKIAKTLSIIPSIKFIGLSGAVAMNNAELDDDIDLFIITDTNSIWRTRLYVSLLLQLMGKRRIKKSQSSVDMVCANMYIADNSLEFSKNRQDIYTAHEIAQLVPLYNTDTTYEKFLLANHWVLNFLPNAIKLSSQNLDINVKKHTQSLLEKIAKFLQLWYMKKHITLEEISDNILAFHPYDYRSSTKSKYEERKKDYRTV